LWRFGRGDPRRRLLQQAADRLLRPLLDASKPPAPNAVRRALATLERAVTQYIHNARLAPAA
jgi:hypothetical protein